MKTQQKQKTSRRNAAAKRAAPVVPVALMMRRATLAAGIVLLATTSLSGPALGAPVTWIGTTGFWDVAGNWSPGIPTAADQVTINVAGNQTITHQTGTSNINSLNNAETLVINNGSTLNVNSGASTNTGTIQAGGASAGTFTLNTLTLTNTGGTLTAANGGVISQNGTTIAGGTLSTSGTGAIRPSNNSSNFLTNVTLSAGSTLDMAQGSQVRERVTGGMTVDGTINLNSSAILALQGTQTIGGSGSIVFGDAFNGTAGIGLDGTNPVITFGPNLTIRGRNGIIGDQAIAGGGGNTFINQGLISADVAGGALLIRSLASAATNQGIIEARNGATMVVLSDITNTGAGQLRVDGANSFISQQGATITGGTINTLNGGLFRPNNNNANVFDGVTVSTGSTIDMAQGSQVRESVINGLTLNGTVNVNSSAFLAFRGNQTIGGSGTIVFGDGSGGNATIGLDGVTPTVTLGSNIVIRGQNGIIGDQVIAGGGAGTLVNNGRVSADVAGGQIVMRSMAGITNNGILEAQNGGTLRLQSNVVGAVASEIRAGAGSTVLQDGVTLSGAINTSGGGSLQPTNSNNNFLDGVNFTGNLNMAVGGQVRERVINGLTLNGTINLNSSALLGLQGTQTIGGTGTFVFGDGSGGNATIGLDGVSPTVTLGSNIMIRGQNGIIGDQAIAGGGAGTLVNNGRISADVAGGQILMRSMAGITNNGILEAQNGGTLRLQSDVNGGAGQINSGAGSFVIQDGVTLTGNINVAGGGSFQPTNNNNNFLDGVNFTGTLNMAVGGQVRERVINGLTLNGTINLNSSALLGLQGTQTIGGTGSIVFGDGSGGNATIGLDGTNPIVTFGPNLTIRGQNGIIGDQAIAGGGGNTFINQGKISADVSGGTITIRSLQATAQNQGIIEARNGGTLQIQSNITNSGAGQLRADGANSIVLQNGATIAGGTINTLNGGEFRPTNSNANFIDGVTVSSGSVVNMAIGSQVRERVLNGMTLDGTLNLGNSAILAFQGTQTLGGSGEIVFANAAGGVGALGVDGANPTLTIGSGMTLRGHSANIGSQILAGGGGNKIINLGLISADTLGGTFTINGLANGMSNSGTVQAKNGGNVSFLSSAILTNETGGLVEALAGSQVTFQSGGTPTNLAGNTLTGGIWRASSLGGVTGGVIDFQGLNTTIATNAADIYLVGANSVIQARNNAFAVTSLDNSLVTNNGALRIHEGRSFTATANSGNFTNNGLLELASGLATSTFKANTSLTNSATGTIAGYGVVDNRPANAGTIVALLGTLSVNGGMTGNGTARADGPAAVLNLSPATAASSAANLDLVNGGGLNLGAQNFNVAKDYTNSAFGVGNAFNARANVTGGGQIIGVGTQQAITGNVTNGAAAVVTLDLGNVRGGTSVTKNYQVANTGAPGAADLRGAVQTSFLGGGVNDARLSGSGVTAQNFGPVAAGGATGNLAVTFNATSGGSLASQSIKIANNFDNVADQTINFTGNASALAVGNATPNSPSPVNLGNFRAGGSGASQGFNVENTTSGAGAERLGIASVSTTGNFAASNVLGGGLINGGATQNGAVSAQASGGVKGVNLGSVTINYRSDGTNIDPTFTSQAANAQTINVSASGYALASAATVGPINFANVLRNSVQERFLTITNQGTIGDAFQEGLNASFGSVTGPNSTKFSVSGGVTNLASGLSNNTAMKVTLDTSAVGSFTAATSVNFASNGTISGLGDTSLGSQAVPLSASVITVQVGDLAQGQVTPTSVDFGNRRVNDVVAPQNLSVANLTQVGEGLQASIAMQPGAIGISASGAPITVAAGAPANNSFAVAIDTTSAGAKTGTARVSMTSDGSFNNGNTTALAPQDVSVQGNVFRLAQASVTPDPVVVAAQRIGGTNSAAVTIANTATADGFSEGLRASGNGSSGDASLSGPASVLIAAGANSTAYGVSVDTTTAGAKNGTVSFALASDGSGTSNIVGNFALLGKTVGVQGNVYARAATDTSAATIDFGTVRRGTVLGAQNVAVSNTATAQALNDSLVVTGISGPASPFGALASANLSTGLTPNQNGSLSATMSTTTAGVFSSSAQVNFASRNPEMADLSLGAKQLNLSGTVNEIASAAFAKAAGAGALSGSGVSYTFDLGTIVQGSDFAQATLRLSNAILASLPGDSLVGSYSASASAPFQLSGFGTIPELAANAFYDALVDIDTSTLGTFLGTILFNGASHNNFQTDLSLAQVSIALRAVIVSNVPPSDVPAPASGALMGLAAGALWWLRRRRVAAPEA